MYRSSALLNCVLLGIMPALPLVAALTFLGRRVRGTFQDLWHKRGYPFACQLSFVTNAVSRCVNAIATSWHS